MGGEAPPQVPQPTTLVLGFSAWWCGGEGPHPPGAAATLALRRPGEGAWLIPVAPVGQPFPLSHLPRCSGNNAIAKMTVKS